MKNIDTKYFKEELEKELAILEKELNTLGKKSPSNPDKWVAIQPEENISESDLNEVADTIDDFESNTAILRDLEIRYQNVKLALQKIEDKTYGVCEVSGEKIDQKRLEANPAARTCKEHIDIDLK